MSWLSPVTVQDFQQIGYTISPSCMHLSCTHYAVLDCHYLASHVGWDFDLYDGRDELRRRLRCSRCGAHWPQLRVSTQRHLSATPMASHLHTTNVSPEEALQHMLALRAEWRARGEGRRWTLLVTSVDSGAECTRWHLS